MQTAFIDYESSEGIATITLNRPEAANAQTLPMLDEPVTVTLSAKAVFRYSCCSTR